MNRALIILFAFFLVISCKEESDFFLQNNESPRLYFSDNQRVKSDYFKLNPETGYLVNYKVIDDQDYTSFSIRSVIGSGNIEVQTDSTLYVYPSITGPHKYYIRISDYYGYKDSIELSLEVFTNLPPIARFEISQENEFLLKIDASRSYDQDSTWGGEVLNYEYTINGNTQITKNNEYLHDIISGIKFYNITLRVQDNDLDWSQSYSESYIIEE